MKFWYENGVAVQYTFEPQIGASVTGEDELSHRFLRITFYALILPNFPSANLTAE